MINDYEKSVTALKAELYELLYYMKGSLSLNEIFNISESDRSIMMKMINKKHRQQSGVSQSMLDD